MIRRLQFLLIATLFMLGCASTPNATNVVLADSVARVANAGLPILAKAYKDSLTTAIVAAAKSEDAAAQAERRPSDRGPAMDAAQAKADAKWAPVWASWAVFRAAQGAWADALEAGQPGTNERQLVETAYCDLAALLPPSARSILTATMVVCPVVPDPDAAAAPDAGSK